jgi:hypothetical protein
LLPRTKKGLVLFWTALFLLSVALQYGSAMLPQRALAAISGAVFTSNFDGSGIDLNIYDSKGAVYLTGGPCQGGSHLEDGTYYYEVTTPNGALLSSDSITERKIVVDGGFIVNASGHVVHDVACTSSDGITVQLLPYKDTTNSGGEYKLHVGLASDVEACDDFASDGFDFIKDCKSVDSKSDNFKVGPNGNLSIRKTVTGYGDFGGTFKFHVDCGEDGEFDATVTVGGAGGPGNMGTTLVEDIADDAECVVTETDVPNAPDGWEWGTVTISPEKVTIKGDDTVDVTVTNPLVERGQPALGFEKSNNAPILDGRPTAEAGDTVTYSLKYTVTDGPVTNGTLEDVLPAGVT